MVFEDVGEHPTKLVNKVQQDVKFQQNVAIKKKLTVSYLAAKSLSCYLITANK